MRIWILALALLLISSACQAGPESFPSAAAVANAMEDEGIECRNLKTTTEVADKKDSLVAERGDCLVDDSAVVISMFETTEDRDDWIAVGKLLSKVAVGENWVVRAESEDVVEDVADSLNATIPET